MSSYIMFMQHVRPVIIAENPAAKFADVGKLAGERWKSLSAAEKAEWKEKARVFLEANPEYGKRKKKSEKKGKDAAAKPYDKAEKPKKVKGAKKPAADGTAPAPQRKAIKLDDDKKRKRVKKPKVDGPAQAARVPTGIPTGLPIGL